MLTRVRSMIRRFLKCEDGPTAVEYAVMLALIVGLCFAAIDALGKQTAKKFGAVARTIGDKPPPAGAGN